MKGEGFEEGRATFLAVPGGMDTRPSLGIKTLFVYCTHLCAFEFE